MLLLLSVSEIGSKLHVDSGVDTTHAKERVGTIFFPTRAKGFSASGQRDACTRVDRRVLISALGDDEYSMLFEMDIGFYIQRE